MVLCDIQQKPQPKICPFTTLEKNATKNKKESKTERELVYKRDRKKLVSTKGIALIEDIARVA